MARAAAEPQERTFRLRQLLGELRDALAGMRERADVRRGQIGGPFDLGGLNVDGNLDADRAARRGLRDAHGFADGRQRGFNGTHAKRGLRDRLQHRQLIGRFVDIREIFIEVFGLDLTGDVQQRGARGQCLDHRARCVARGRAGAGERDAESAGNARETIGHVHRARFAARADVADLAALMDRVEDRHVVDRDHAECGMHPALLEKSGDQFADGGCVRHVVQRLQKHRCGCPSYRTTAS